MSEARSTKSAINSIILDYLITSGFVGAAEKFIQESELSKTQSIDLDRIRARVEVRNLICTGQIQSAIEAINSLNAEVLDKDSSLHFRLLQLQLIEIIREVPNKGGDNPSAADFRPALEFATQQLAPHAPRDPKHLSALEKTMALTIFRSDKMIPEIKELLDERLRDEIAEEVNEALLIADSMAPEARIKELVRARAWAEQKARDARVDLPSDTSIGLDVGDSDQTMVS